MVSFVIYTCRIIASCDQQGIVFLTKDNFTKKTNYCCAWYLAPLDHLKSCQVCGHELKEENELLVTCIWRCSEDTYTSNSPTKPELTALERRYRESEIQYLSDCTHRYLQFLVLKDAKPFPEPGVGSWEEFQEDVKERIWTQNC